MINWFLDLRFRAPLVIPNSCLTKFMICRIPLSPIIMFQFLPVIPESVMTGTPILLLIFGLQSSGWELLRDFCLSIELPPSHFFCSADPSAAAHLGLSIAKGTRWPPEARYEGKNRGVKSRRRRRPQITQVLRINAVIKCRMQCHRVRSTVAVGGGHCQTFGSRARYLNFSQPSSCSVRTKSCLHSLYEATRRRRQMS